MKHPAATFFLLSFLMGASAWSQVPVPVGVQFQVNSYTTGYQGWYGTDVAMAGNGDFVVVWANGSYYDQSDYSIQGQRFAANGTPQGSEFQVNSYPTNREQYPAMGVGPGGGFVVVWESKSSIQGQRFAADGSPQGDEFQVNSYDTGSQVWPAMAVGPGGEFVVVWSSYGSYSTDTSYYSIQGRRFAANGTPQGSDFLVNTYTTSSQWTPAVEIGPDGDFVVVWFSFGSDGTDTSASIQGQRFGANGSPQGGEFQVNSYTTGYQSMPEVAVGPSSDFVVVWTSSGSDGTDTDGSVQGQLFAANGSPQGDEFQVNSYTTGFQGAPEVTANIQGDFVVAWTSNGSDGTDTSSNSVQGQRFAANGSPQGDEFQVNSYTTSFQGAGGVAADANGNFVVIWGSNGSDGTDTSYRSIQGQRYAPELIFTDGFESGDTSVWSNTVP